VWRCGRIGEREFVIKKMVVTKGIKKIRRRGRTRRTRAEKRTGRWGGRKKKFHALHSGVGRSDDK